MASSLVRSLVRQWQTAAAGGGGLVVNGGFGTFMPKGEVGTPYSFTVPVSGGISPYFFIFDYPPAVAGLSINLSSGVISGTPTVYNNGNVFSSYGSTSQVLVFDSSTNRLTNFAIGPSLLQKLQAVANGAGFVGAPPSFPALLFGGVALYSYIITSGSIPTGLSIDTSTDSLTGNCSTAGTYNYTLQITDSIGVTSTLAQTIVVYPNNPNYEFYRPSAFPPGGNGQGIIVNVPYTNTVDLSYGSIHSPPYTYTLVSGTLPPGLSLNTTNGTVSGTPTTLGAYTVVISLTNAIPLTTNTSWTFIVTAN
ncbi:MAG: Ig domain-containing protein [Candidatus Dormibacteria bacterium]